MNDSYFSGVSSAMSRFAGSYAAARRAYAYYQHLNHMSDQQLARRGLARSDLAGAARAEFDRG